MNSVIKVKKLSKNYNDIVALKNFDFDVNKKEIVGILGANSAGKTTAIECMVGVKKPSSGDVEILNLNPIIDRKRLFERVGVQFQDGTYQENIKVGELC